MSATTNHGLQYATGGDAAAIHTISQNLATSASPRIVGQFPNTGARDTAYSADIAAGRVGMMCYCVAEDGHCVYRGSRGWKWLTYYEILSDTSWAGPGGVTGPWPTNLGAILLTTGTVVLPGSGLRRLEITAVATAKGQSGSGLTPCGIQVVGSGVTNANQQIRLQGVGDSFKETRTINLHFTAQGSQVWQLWGYVFFTSDTVYFEGMQMQLIDHGPA